MLVIVGSSALLVSGIVAPVAENTTTSNALESTDALGTLAPVAVSLYPKPVRPIFRSDTITSPATAALVVVPDSRAALVRPVPAPEVGVPAATEKVMLFVAVVTTFSNSSTTCTFTFPSAVSTAAGFDGWASNRRWCTAAGVTTAVAVPLVKPVADVVSVQLPDLESPYQNVADEAFAGIVTEQLLVHVAPADAPKRRVPDEFDDKLTVVTEFGVVVGLLYASCLTTV